MVLKRIRRHRPKIRVPIEAKDPHVIKLFKYLDAKDIPLWKVEQVSGVGTNVLSKWRSGANRPRLDMFVAACEAVGLSLQIQLELEL